MKYRILSTILSLMFLTACNGTFGIKIEETPVSPVVSIQATAALPVPKTIQPVTAAPVLVTSTPQPASTSTQAPANTADPLPATTAVSLPPIPDYIDDRSSASQVILSLFNAINRQEYLRAYNYWTNPTVSQGDFTTYASGYKDTALVNLSFGQITADAGAGQIYFTVPVIIKATARNGTHANYAACYVVHQSQPGNFGAPPFIPMGIDQGGAKVSDINASDGSVLATACNGFPIGGSPVAISGGNLSIDKSNFLDNRSGPLETVSSLLNAINLKQYARAYSYFQSPANFPGPFDPFVAGYAETDSVTVIFGTVHSEGAAGSLYFKVPLSMKVLTTSAGAQTYVGCYTLRQAQPALQAVPPFQPMGIIAGNFTLVTDGTDGNSFLPTACN